MRTLDPRVLRAALAQSRSQRRRRGRKGMNLIEIMIVVAIIVILIGVLSYAAFEGWESFKVSQTKLQISEMGKLIHSEMMFAGADAPNSLSEVEGVKENMLKDGWGREFEYVSPGPGGQPFEIISYGRDGAEGGAGRDADIKYSEM